MTERQVSSEKCVSCPHRGRISRLLARATRQSQLAEGCEGSVRVSHGQIVTQVRIGGEPSPPQKTWNSLSSCRSNDGTETRYYRRNDWETEIICGRESVEPREGEVPYALSGESIRTNAAGQRVAAFIKGDEDALSSHYGMLGIMELLDATTEMEDAQDAGDTEGADKALARINQAGFAKPISAGRRGSGKNKSA